MPEPYPHGNPHGACWKCQAPLEEDVHEESDAVHTCRKFSVRSIRTFVSYRCPVCRKTRAVKVEGY